MNPLVLTYRELQSEGKSHLWPSSQTWYKAVAVAVAVSSSHNCIQYTLLLPSSSILSCLATKMIHVIFWRNTELFDK